LRRESASSVFLYSRRLLRRPSPPRSTPRRPFAAPSAGTSHQSDSSSAPASRRSWLHRARDNWGLSMPAGTNRRGFPSLYHASISYWWPISPATTFFGRSHCRRQQSEEMNAPANNAPSALRHITGNVPLPGVDPAAGGARADARASATPRPAGDRQRAGDHAARNDSSRHAGSFRHSDARRKDRLERGTRPRRCREPDSSDEAHEIQNRERLQVVDRQRRRTPGGEREAR